MMYATTFSLGPCRRRTGSITRLTWGILVATAAFLRTPCTDLRVDAFDSAQDRPVDVAQGRPWREAPEYLALFAPRTHRDAYRTYRSPLGLEETLRALLTESGGEQPAGAWEVQAVTPFEAFGRTGSYNRWQLAGLYGSRRVRVARGPRLDQGYAESWTLVAPYPDPALRRLEPGTLIIVLRIPPV
jgi:hypothetical protein